MTTPPPPPPPPRVRSPRADAGIKNPHRRFSIRAKLMILFWILITLALFTQGFFAVSIAKKALDEKIERMLVYKASDTAALVNERINALFQLLEGIGRIPFLLDSDASYEKKAAYLYQEAHAHDVIQLMSIADTKGYVYTYGKEPLNVSVQPWYSHVMQGKKFLSEPFTSSADGKLIMIAAIPLYNQNRTLLGALNVRIDAFWLSENTKDIVVGKTGSCYILGLTGNTIAHAVKEVVEQQGNSLEQSKTDSAFVSVAQFQKNALSATNAAIGYYDFYGVDNIAAYAKIKETGWTVIVRAPHDEFMETIRNLQFSLNGIGIIILVVSLAVVFIAGLKIIRPINTVVNALQNIAQGEGNLKVRLPIRSNDEVSDLSHSFNQTIEKIAQSIHTVGANTLTMKDIGIELADNMNETATAVDQISTNINGVKQQAQSQASRVTESVASVEEIITTIKQLNSSIENQASHVAQSSSAVEEMVANIASITQTLDKTNDTIKTLAKATADGKDTILSSTAVTQKIAEESGSLLEASSVIQHIASQTNLLAMNAAIEAAHAGEAGKGFAVVADEIRKLAEESSSQGKTITQTLKILSGEIEQLSESSKTAGEKFNAIFTLSDQVKNMSNQLMEAMQEQQHGSYEVLHAIKSINTVTAEVQADSEKMLVRGEGVTMEMRKLNELTRYIINSMNEMASGAVQIRNAVRDVSTISQKNKVNIENLVNEVGKFKV